MPDRSLLSGTSLEAHREANSRSFDIWCHRWSRRCCRGWGETQTRNQRVSTQNDLRGKCEENKMTPLGVLILYQLLLQAIGILLFIFFSLPRASSSPPSPKLTSIHRQQKPFVSVRSDIFSLSTMQPLGSPSCYFSVCKNWAKQSRGHKEPLTSLGCYLMRWSRVFSWLRFLPLHLSSPFVSFANLLSASVASHHRLCSLPSSQFI